MLTHRVREVAEERMYPVVLALQQLEYNLSNVCRVQQTLFGAGCLCVVAWPISKQCFPCWWWLRIPLFLSLQSHFRIPHLAVSLRVPATCWNFPFWFVSRPLSAFFSPHPCLFFVPTLFSLPALSQSHVDYSEDRRVSAGREQCRGFEGIEWENAKTIKGTWEEVLERAKENCTGENKKWQ